MHPLSFMFDHRYARTVRFLISGGAAAVVDLGLLYVLTYFFDQWYLLSTVVAFVAAFGVSFTLQKMWTFDDRSFDLLHTQLVRYLALACAGLAFNTAAMFVLVEYAGFRDYVIVAQILTTGGIAVVNFFVYKHFIFTKAGAAEAPPASTNAF